MSWNRLFSRVALPMTALVVSVVLAVPVMSKAEPASSDTVTLAHEWRLEPRSGAECGDMQQIARIIEARLDDWGTVNTVVSSKEGITVKFPAQEAGKLEQLRIVLTSRGGASIHEMVEPTSNDRPDGSYYSETAGSIEDGGPFLVRKAPLFAPTPTSGARIVDHGTGVMVEIPLSREDRARFASLTEERVGEQVCIVVDEHFWSTPVIMARVFGDLVIQTEPSIFPVEVLAALVSAPSFEPCLEIAEETIIEETHTPEAEATIRAPHLDPAAVELYERGLDDILSLQPNPPRKARLQMSATDPLYGQADAEFLFKYPDSQCVRMTSSYLKFYENLRSQGVFTNAPPIDILDDLMRRREGSRVEWVKRVGRHVLGYADLGPGSIGSIAAITQTLDGDLEAIRKGRGVDLIHERYSDREVLRIKGIEDGPFEQQEMRVVWVAGSDWPDSLNLLTSETDTRAFVKWTEREGSHLISRSKGSVGIHGDKDRQEFEIEFQYRRIEGHWIAVEIMARIAGEELSFKVNQTDFDPSLDDEIWEDRIEYVDRETVATMVSQAPRSLLTPVPAGPAPDRDEQVR
ncbi:MAG: hypothetical protein KDA27_17300 [Candidatus Eisenbacteria bacterium]|uniref:Uncharacterized protein n=1 Tax=Eiseniibacteriota bacterium TaxID=2212470 RepID=A0A956SEG9_UNCEI|nr:hypothetical protein [Candidatus Eisenbacteria bacterium]MCB9466458.1 hypothetical protein [Candidatus Eisenbacteria bacterium]